MITFSAVPVLDRSVTARMAPRSKSKLNDRKHFSVPTNSKIHVGDALTKKRKDAAASSSSSKGGRAARELKAMRLKVYHNIPGEKLTLIQMAKECGIFGSDGKPSGSSYQYIEQSVGDFFPLDKVNLITPPLSRRGISVAEIKRRLMGEISQVVGNATPVVSSRSSHTIQSREVPVLTRETALKFLRGDLDIQQLIKAPAAMQQWESSGLVIGYRLVDDASEDTVIFNVLDGQGSQIAVDPNLRELIDGKSYVWTLDGKNMFFSRWLGGVMIAREGPQIGRVLPFDPDACTILGRMIWFMSRD